MHSLGIFLICHIIGPRSSVVDGICKNLLYLPITVLNREWASWGRWSPCSKTCGFQTRHRVCPRPETGGSGCSTETEEATEMRICSSSQNCPGFTFKIRVPAIIQPPLNIFEIVQPCRHQENAALAPSAKAQFFLASNA